MAFLALLLARFFSDDLHLVNLVVLDLSKSKITDYWDGWRQIEMAKELKILDLTGCSLLTKTLTFQSLASWRN
ncbi:uncharacterized protein J3R85_000641 [Psidium guajava]|nr:uncharacterized protein J3R85_000641 [Psidium guajava]